MDASASSGQRLRTARRAHGFSQRALAEAVDISRQAVAALEAGRISPSLPLALALARRLGATVEQLFGAEPAGDVEVATGAARGLTPGARVVMGRVAGALVARPLDPLHGGVDSVECADGIVSSVRPDAARIAPLAAAAARGDRVILGGCDLSLGLLARHAARRAAGAEFLWFPVDNRRALDDLLAGRAHAAAVHVADLRSWERALGARGAIPLRRYAVADVYQGWIVAHGNPRGIRGARDLVQRGVRLVNRPAGAGARTLLEAELRRAHLDPARVEGYAHVVSGQLDAARAVAQGFADAAVGTAGVARWFGLDFLPLRSEHCVLVVPSAIAGDASIRAAVEALRSPEYRRELEALDSYETARTGDEQIITA
ncbi:MAG TPA: substrate-binding domain-containing protein [Candidatus Dormibacteraeota bacterium]|nr:substrate-binding domain-containing protein [Candidatus Dormibacteraeota bacterium]